MLLSCEDREKEKRKRKNPDRQGKVTGMAYSRWKCSEVICYKVKSPNVRVKVFSCGGVGVPQSCG